MRKILLLIFVIALYCPLSAQTIKPVAEMTQEDIMALTYDQLLALPFEDLIALADKVGLSADELLEKILNKEVTSASKRAEKSLNSPLSITVISKDELENSGVTSIPEALRLVPGMIVREKTNGNYDVHIRGNDNIPAKNMPVYSEDAMTLVMIDGRPVYNYAFGGTFWETLPIEISDIDRIEVIRGPASALYGPNAVSGAINIVTKQVEENKLHVNGQIQQGTSTSTLANLAVSGGLGKFKYRVSGNYSRLGRFEDDLYVFTKNKRYNPAECDTMKDAYGMFLFRDTSLSSNFKKYYTDPDIATEKYGANVYFFYNQSKNVSASLSMGAQESDVITTPLGQFDVALDGRYSKSGYVNLGAQFYGFTLQANHNVSNAIIQRGSIGWKVDSKASTGSLEYEHKFGSLVLRPGIGFQQASYDDKKYINESIKEGFLNGEKKITAFSGFLRADYRAFDKLRLIAALRGEKYNYPDKTYFTYQFISSYDINERNVVRVVYSRANRGPFVVDTQADYQWIQTPENNYGVPSSTIYWIGNKNLKLPVMDMFEIGYRCRPFKNVMIDLEAFYTQTKDFSYFIPDTMTIAYSLLTAQMTSIKTHIQYYNFDMKTEQKGITANVSIAVTPSLTFKVFGTLQETKVKDFYNKTITNITNDDMPSNIISQTFTTSEVIYTATNPSLVNGKINPDSLTDTYNKSTPTFYGGGSIEYKPFDKLTINSTCYYFSKNKLINSVVDVVKNDPSSYSVDAKFILSLKVSYKIWKDNAIFVNARNALNNQSREFAFVDKVKGLYLVGLNFNF
jgi:iron complex outermembrane recepter protein